MVPQAAPADPAGDAALVHLSCVVGSPILDRAGDRLGKVKDLIVRLDGSTYPPVSGLVAKIGGRELFVPMQRVSAIEPGAVSLEGETLNLGRFERRPGEVLLAKDLRSRHVINVNRARLVRANEIELSSVDGGWKVVGVDTSSRPVVRRMLPRSLRRRVRPGQIVDWSGVEPFVAHVPSARLRLPFRKLARLHPAQLADLVEAASHDEGEEIISAVGQDTELEADVFEELDPDHQVEFIRSRSDGEAARVLAKMAPDDAADLLVELDHDRRLPVLSLMPWPEQRKIRSLLRYNPETAGGLMNPDFLALPGQTDAARALDRVRAPGTPPDAAGVVYLTDGQGRLSGVVPLIALVRAEPTTPLSALSRGDPVALQPDADLHEVTRTMTDFNLAVVPVTDEDGKMLGQINVDDVLELLLPAGWRREYGMSSAE
ncbi:MAG: magnesium transporter [Acidimicrobiales bacterium]|nr:magnesium transporter [Acidimicrobiales bacterium]MBO0893022.1 magnesium transporter [Acidimicrobiales bacterium]